MTLDQTALVGLLEILRAADVTDRVRQAAETLYPALIEVELTAAPPICPPAPDTFIPRH